MDTKCLEFFLCGLFVILVADDSVPEAADRFEQTCLAKLDMLLF